MHLSLGISTCPNDTYIYEALIAGLENSPFEWEVHYADVQTLNEMVRQGVLDVAKVSAQVFPKIECDYRHMQCGGAIGYGCGPLLLSSAAESFNPGAPTTLPGADTTAALLFKFWYEREIGGDPSVRYALFNEVYQSLREGKSAQGVVIHEHRFTWKRDGLHLLADLGAYWEDKTNSPIPLGISVIRRRFSEEIVHEVESEIRRSIAVARERKDLVTPFIERLAQIEDRKVIEDHIKMFVNDFSENVGERGAIALRRLWQVAVGKKT